MHHNKVTEGTRDPVENIIQHFSELKHIMSSEKEAPWQGGTDRPSFPSLAFSFMQLNTKQNKNPQPFKKKFKKRVLKFKYKRRNTRINKLEKERVKVSPTRYRNIFQLCRNATIVMLVPRREDVRGTNKTRRSKQPGKKSGEQQRKHHKSVRKGGAFHEGLPCGEIKQDALFAHSTRNTGETEPEDRIRWYGRILGDAKAKDGWNWLP